MRAVRNTYLSSTVLATLVIAAAFAAACPPARASAATAQIRRLPAQAPQSAARFRSGTTKIQHVIFVIQENRSFNYLFMGFPGATTQNYGYDQSGKKIPLHAQTLAGIWDIDHSSTAFLTAYDDGKLDGWNSEQTCCTSAPKNFAYAYAPRHEVLPYWEMAKSYVLADNMFQSNLDGSYVAHQYAIAAYASHTVNYTTGPWGCSGGPSDTVETLKADRTIGPTRSPCLNNKTIADMADKAGVPWRFYAGVLTGDGGVWSSYQAIKHIYTGPDWTNDVISPPAQFLTDIGNGSLAAITWITPLNEDSDHAGLGFASTNGPKWVSSVVDAVGQSQFWNTSAIFVIWDDWGGWYDPVEPVYEDYDGLGFRIPMLVISPYAKKGYVTHIQYETSSVLRLIEDNFGFGQLAPSDTRAADPVSDVFDFSGKPRKFRAFAGSQPAQFWRMSAAAAKGPVGSSPPGFGD